MTKRNWSVTVQGYKPFPMLTLDGAISRADALAARNQYGLDEQWSDS